MTIDQMPKEKRKYECGCLGEEHVRPRMQPKTKGGPAQELVRVSTGGGWVDAGSVDNSDILLSVRREGFGVRGC